ncbi:hypothetical protein BGZ80_001640 [Entomortierella chlamydospora]|uniref:Uncharacterized protein n=1 Tax=Entomortierella chlamydospora TaxID=101097 RepID=A0A9P6T3G3_9FUNG|nr:hypothetical protein BGZ79_003258 [Entomortierella chlamydospora]KAG0021812.1 hypothetical protein BGZ80_001640 [Entomortierella chlamydospora]
MNLPCLEELELNNWIVSNELLAGILGTCSSTLKTLTLESINGFDKMLFTDCDTNKYNDRHGDEDNTGAHPLFQLTNLTTLNIHLDWTQSQGVLYLPRICPALQNLVITVGKEEHDLSQLITSLRTCCPQLTSIKYIEGYSMRHEHGFFPDPELHASLFKDSTTCLKTMHTRLPVGLDSHMINAVLSHGSNLEDLELANHINYDYQTETERALDVSEVQKIFVHCRNLKQLILEDAMLSINDLGYLCIEPWVCRNLEKLVIEDHAQPVRIEGDDVQDGAENDSSRGQLQGGWFRVTGLLGGRFRNAQVDSEFVRKFLFHLSETSGLKSLRYIRLNDLELNKSY